jgi:hypothetical protein
MANADCELRVDAIRSGALMTLLSVLGIGELRTDEAEAQRRHLAQLEDQIEAVESDLTDDEESA